ncbi:phospho-N-acetylmuramoyl-pentapeptide-transferase [bacterium]|nr:phospho-N-acetylmuramoyl-pentapeptide-transferase [bacterium]NBX97901.1 phospho-N-acetylmuramoyl-pentapeptide-transferase [bacterium]NDC93859.1 phospho-N-acetylmuramoyl-pentapeptide-transferase [bacterium]NDD82806.1 phospho-N-acetylmuramoyl-pentapeptide-transferase [bacterium]NDG28745.1 phospho-N-acetylmuramoyl-pentapeptide-transferase [bacterium]
MNLNISLDLSTVLQPFLFAFFAFALSMAITPLYTTLAYKYEWWKKARTNAVTGESATVYQQLHAKKHRRNIPTMAGSIFVLTTLLITLVANLSRVDTWLPLSAMVGAGCIGLVDDILNIRGFGGGIAGMRASLKSWLIFAVAAVGGWWFYAKLDVTGIHVPFFGQLALGIFVIPLFVLVVVSCANAVNISDGLDGLAGGLCVSAFSAYAIIAMLEGRYGIAGFCLTIVGALLSYTWFNIFPARFFMGDVGSFALGTALGVVALLTDTVLILPIIGLLFVTEAGSSLLQIASKKLRNGKKIFKIAPIHHHFEASGWPETKVTMRFWIIGQISAVIGILLYLLGRTP